MMLCYDRGKGPRIQQPRIFVDIPGICHKYLPISRGRYPNPNPNRKKLKMHLATEKNYSYCYFSSLFRFYYNSSIFAIS